uniref:Ornithine decarboxylase antizyme n=1 Tax=Bursaphelenchus xylophilus TaxID=6326 RepID=A0A1I7SGT0_BURXY
MHEIPTNLTLYMDSRTKIDMDQFVVRCFETPQTGKNETKKDEYKIYQRPFAGYAKQGLILISCPDIFYFTDNFFNFWDKKKTLTKSTPEKPSLIVLVLDSTSRNQFLRHAPKSWKFMEELGFVTLKGYNKIGDNSGVNLFPIVAGKTPERQVGGDGKEVLQKEELPVVHENHEHLWDLFKSMPCCLKLQSDVIQWQKTYHSVSGKYQKMWQNASLS